MTDGQSNAEFPEFVGRYQIIRRLGEGGMGSVFLARDTILHREVALKLPLSGTENDPEVRERFLREARSAATLDHPYICRVYDADVVEGRLYMAMAYIEGKSLADLVRAEGIPPRQVVALVGKLAIAMNQAHLKGVVHRDLKPRNVMIRKEGSKKEPVIVDFGLARLESAEDVRMTKTGDVMGTPAYMAPEQLRGKPDEIGASCDIYALGVILYELLTGQLPFSGNYPVLVAQILMQPALPPSTYRPGLDPALDAICLKALEKNVSDRYASMMELATALTEYLRAAPSVSISNRTVSPISRPIEGDSIATGADTLVSQFLGRSEEREKRISLGLVLDSPPAALATEAVRRPKSGFAFLVPSTAEGESRRMRLWWGLAASGLLAVLVLAGIIVLVRNPGNRPKVEDIASANPVPKTLTKVPTLPDVPKLSNKPKTVVETPPPPKVAETLITNTIGMNLKLIPAGEFLMGAANGEPDAQNDEKPQHKVRITRQFYLGTTEVTVGQFRRFVDEKNFKTDAEKDGKGGNSWDESRKAFFYEPRFTWRSPGFPQTDDHPVTNVSWNDAMGFCEWLSWKEGQNYRLPTEAEWEYSCRAGQTTWYYSGNDPESLAKVGNVADSTAREKFPNWPSAIKAVDGFVFTAPAGQFQPNAFGLYDMHGNVWEWCQDWYDADYYLKSPTDDPLNLIRGMNKVGRGGGWHSPQQDCRTAHRDRRTPNDRRDHLGFRIAQTYSHTDIPISSDKAKTLVETHSLPKPVDPLITNTIGMNLKLIPAGEFFRGVADGEPEAREDEKPQIKVQITRPFYLGIYEVTQAEYRAVVGTNPSWFSPDGKGKEKVTGIVTDRFPVEYVTWYDAIKFCNQLSEREGYRPYYSEVGEPIASGMGYRLPTEAEWEYACRGVIADTSKNSTAFAFGQVISSADANFNGTFSYNGSAKGPNLERPSLVGTYRPNALGLYDMHGNVWEWCDDWYDIGYYARSPVSDPQNLSHAAAKVLRGGNWGCLPSFCRSAFRGTRTPGDRLHGTGFRVARTLSTSVAKEDTKQSSSNSKGDINNFKGKVQQRAASNLLEITSPNSEWVGYTEQYLNGKYEVQANIRIVFSQRKGKDFVAVYWLRGKASLEFVGTIDDQGRIEIYKVVKIDGVWSDEVINTLTAFGSIDDRKMVLKYSNKVTGHTGEMITELKK